MAEKEKRLIARGENAVESKHIKSFRFAPELRLLTGEVYASMRDRAYNVEVNLDEDGEVKSCSCTCPRGEFICHHVAAICIYGHHNIAITDVECQWSQRKSKEEPPKLIEEIYVGKSHRSTERNLTDEKVEELQKKLQMLGTAVGFTWLLRSEPTDEVDIIPNIEDFLFSEYLTSLDKINYFVETMKVSDEIIVTVSNATVGQRKNEKWLTCKKNRLTASNFGVVLGAISRGRYPPSLFKRLAGVYNLEHVKAVQWGNLHEDTAIQVFTENTHLQVIPTGLWLDPSGFLGASPDGLVGDKAIIEVKCPFKYREKSLQEELRKDMSYIIKFNEDGDIEINKNHEYYQQIQGVLSLTKRDLCHLIIWTPSEVIIAEIPKEDGWDENVDRLKTFYIENYLSYLIGSIVIDDHSKLQH